MTKKCDALAISVKQRIRFATDLYAADGVYHNACDLSFREGINVVVVIAVSSTKLCLSFFRF